MSDSAGGRFAYRVSFPSNLEILEPGAP